MALLRKNLASRFLSFCRPSSAGGARAAGHGSPIPKLYDSHGRAGEGFLRKIFLQKRGIFETTSSSSISAERIPFPIGSKLLEKLGSINGDRIRLDMLRPPVQSPIPPDREEKTSTSISVEDARKILRLSFGETVKSRLRDTGKTSISYSDYVKICCEGFGQVEQGLGLAKALDESGFVLVLGNTVFLRPDQVAKAVERVIPKPVPIAEDDPRRDELREMERKKMEIDLEAEAGVRRELWGGLAYLVIQTAAFMRLTFWELSWDVMEPVCFYVTSFYFMFGYAFFLRTARDPSFEGFFESRFAAKQRRLMRTANFDVSRFLELRRIFLGLDLSAEAPRRLPRNSFLGSIH